MPSREPERAEYERRVVEWLRGHFLKSDHRVGYPSGGRIEFEDVRLEGAGSEESSVVITFRVPGRSGCLYGRRETRWDRPNLYKTRVTRPSNGRRWSGSPSKKTS